MRIVPQLLLVAAFTATLAETKLRTEKIALRQRDCVGAYPGTDSVNNIIGDTL
jgi:hypothetical protein